METGHVFRRIGRYVLGAPIAFGGMGTVRFGRHVQLPRVVAVKQLRAELANDPSTVGMFEDEVQLLSRVRHKNVVAPIEFIVEGGEYFIVMEYVAGESLARLCTAARGPLSVALACKIVGDVLAGLQAAHEASDPQGEPLGLVHRDVTPHNIVVGVDGDSRILDFGVAKAARRAQVTEFGQLKGKWGYMAPEQLAFENVDARADLYAVGVVLWELLVGRRLFARAAEAPSRIDDPAIPAPSSLVAGVPSAIDQVVLRALSRNPRLRYTDARQMADALQIVAPPCRNCEVGDWVERLAHAALMERQRCIVELEALPVASTAWSSSLPETPEATSLPTPPGNSASEMRRRLAHSERPVSHDLVAPRHRSYSMRTRLAAATAALVVASVPVWAWFRDTRLHRVIAGDSEPHTAAALAQPLSPMSSMGAPHDAAARDGMTAPTDVTRGVPATAGRSNVSQQSASSTRTGAMSTPTVLVRGSKRAVEEFERRSTAVGASVQQVHEMPAPSRDTTAQLPTNEPPGNSGEPTVPSGAGDAYDPLHDTRRR